MRFSPSSASLLTLLLLGACVTPTTGHPPGAVKPHVERPNPKTEGYDAEKCSVSEWKPGPNGCSFSKTLKTGCETDRPCPTAEIVQFQGTLACDETRSVCGRVETCVCQVR